MCVMSEQPKSPAVERVPLVDAFRFRPTEGGDWEAVGREYREEHPVVMGSLRDELVARGVLTPIDVFREGHGWAVSNGHHRLLAAQDVGLPAVPVRYWEREADIPRVKRYWDPELRRDYGPEEDEHGVGQLRY